MSNLGRWLVVFIPISIIGIASFYLGVGLEAVADTADAPAIVYAFPPLTTVGWLVYTFSLFLPMIFFAIGGWIFYKITENSTLSKKQRLMLGFFAEPVGIVFIVVKTILGLFLK